MNQRKLDDLDFYEKYLLNAGQAERDKYIEEHPDFLNDYPVSYEHRELLQDELYRKLLRRIRAYETGEKAEKKENLDQEEQQNKEQNKVKEVFLYNFFNLIW